MREFAEMNLLVLGCYVILLIIIGFLGRRASKGKTLADFFVQSRGMGLLVLFFTLYATQYSGNTVVGFAAKGYREGFYFVYSAILMMGVIGAYLIFAPKLQKLSQKKHYITAGDYLADRFGGTRLIIISSIIYVWALGNYIISNLKAVGYVVSAITGDMISFGWGIILLAIVMLFYEMMGGMRAVAWTDAIQGFLLLFGCISIFLLFTSHYGGLNTLIQQAIQARPNLNEAPRGTLVLHSVSMMLVFYFGISMYPQAIQRIYAASSGKTLQKSFQIMVFMPLLTTLPIVVMGILANGIYPGLDKPGSEGITLKILTDLAHNEPAFRWLILIFICAMVAAIMSTVDSALLSISSIWTKDLYARMRPNSSETALLKMGKWSSFLVMALGVILAICLPQTIWRLLEIKLEILMQMAPAFFLGIHWMRMRESSVFWGITSGCLVSVGMEVFSVPNLGLHAGLWGLIINLTVIVIMQFLYHNSAHDISAQRTI